MNKVYYRWQKLFLFCLGIFIAAAFCMKWMESALTAGGKLFTVIGLEISYPKQKVIEIMSSFDPGVSRILRYHLSFDFIFMPGVYLGILSLCMMAKYKTTSRKLRSFLLVLGCLQLVAWLADITENIFLLRWIYNPAIGSEYSAYHYIVIAKWVIALMGVFVATPFVLRWFKTTASPKG